MIGGGGSECEFGSTGKDGWWVGWGDSFEWGADCCTWCSFVMVMGCRLYVRSICVEKKATSNTFAICSVVDVWSRAASRAWHQKSLGAIDMHRHHMFEGKFAVEQNFYCAFKLLILYLYVDFWGVILSKQNTRSVYKFTCRL